MGSRLNRRSLAPAVFLVALAGCGEATKLDIKVPEGLDPQIKQLVTSAWPKVKQVCQGLDRHANALKFKGIEDNRNVSVVFQIPESGTTIPANYMAGGHTCYFDISRDGNQVTVAKEGCKAVCLDRALAKDEAANQGDLVLALGGKVAPSTPSAEVKQSKLSAAEAKQLASETLSYFTQYQKMLADDAVMNEDALSRVFNGQELQTIVKRWPAPFTGDLEAERYMGCQNLLVSASGYAHAQHDFAFKGLPEKNVLPLRKQFKQDLKDCKKTLAS